MTARTGTMSRAEMAAAITQQPRDAFAEAITKGKATELAELAVRVGFDGRDSKKHAA